MGTTTVAPHSGATIVDPPSSRRAQNHLLSLRHCGIWSCDSKPIGPQLIRPGGIDGGAAIADRSVLIDSEVRNRGCTQNGLLRVITRWSESGGDRDYEPR
jgi:hypothetical protein